MKRGDLPSSAPEIIAGPSNFGSSSHGPKKSYFSGGAGNGAGAGSSQAQLQAKARAKLQRRKAIEAETAARRKLPESFSDIGFDEPSKKSRKRTVGPKVNYVKPIKKKKPRKLSRFEWSWTKLGWMMCALLVVRLTFMESGLVDYHSMHKTLEKKQSSLELLRVENAELIQEIHKIKTSPRYQKKLARDHLGVIAKDEYLILFSRESELSSSI